MRKWIILLFLFLLGVFFDIFFFHAFSYDESIPLEIFWEIRIPRVIISGLVGASLSLAGILIQGLTRNPLSSPSVLGISSFSAFFVCSAISTGFFSGTGLLVPGFLGTISGTLSFFILGKILQGNIYPERLILIGICQGFLMASLTNLVVLMDEANTQGLLFWLLGGVDGKSWPEVKILTFTFLPSLILFFILIKKFDLLILNDDLIQSLGLNANKIRLIGFLICSLLVSGSVVACGPISFVGLIVPHLGKKITGESLKKSAGYSILLGVVFLIYADFFSRIVQFPYETPVGIISGILGAVYFIVISARKKVYA